MHSAHLLHTEYHLSSAKPTQMGWWLIPHSILYTMDFSCSTICEGNACVISARLVYIVLYLKYQSHCWQCTQLLTWVGKWWFNGLWQPALLRKRLWWAFQVLPGLRCLCPFTDFTGSLSSPLMRIMFFIYCKSMHGFNVGKGNNIKLSSYHG